MLESPVLITAETAESPVVITRETTPKSLLIVRKDNKKLKYNVKTVYIISNLSGGGSIKYLDDLKQQYTNVKFVHVKNKASLLAIENANPYDILFVQQLLWCDILPEHIINIKNKFSMQIIMSIHDFCWFIQDDNINNPENNVWEQGYLLNISQINSKITSLFHEAEIVIHPSEFTQNHYNRLFPTHNSIVQPHNDIELNYFIKQIPKVTNNTINIGNFQGFSARRDQSGNFQGFDARMISPIADATLARAVRRVLRGGTILQQEKDTATTATTGVYSPYERRDPPGIDGAGMLHNLRANLVDHFARVILPWQESVTVEFEDCNGDARCRQGYDLVQAGNLAGAEPLFTQVIGAYQNAAMPVPPNEAEKIGEAFYNRGLTRSYLGQYARAVADLTRAISLRPDESDWQQELQSAQRMSQDQEALRQQGAVANETQNVQNAGTP